MDDLNAIAIFERSRGPVYAAYDVVIEFDRDPFRGKIEGFDEFVEREAIGRFPSFAINL